MFKFLHHTLPIPTVSSTDHIVKAARNLHQAIDGTTATAPDELQAIEHICALLLGTTEPPLLPEHPVQQNAPQQINSTDPPSFKQPIKQPLQQPVQTNSPLNIPSNRQSPHIIPFNDNELDDSTIQGSDNLSAPL